MFCCYCYLLKNEAYLFTKNVLKRQSASANHGHTACFVMHKSRHLQTW